MLDPSISPPSAAPLSPRSPSPPWNTPSFPSPDSSSEWKGPRGALLPVTGTPLEGARLVSGTGEDLGVVVGVQSDRRGQPKWIAFQEDATSEELPRLAPLKYVKSFE